MGIRIRAFALRGVTAEAWVNRVAERHNLAEFSALAPNTDFADFDALNDAAQNALKLVSIVQTCRAKISRHYARLQNYQTELAIDADKFNRDDFLKVYRAKCKRLAQLFADYRSLAKNLAAIEERISNMLASLETERRSFWTKLFAVKLKQARLAANLTQGQLADTLGIKRTSYNQIENARNEPNISVLALAARVLGKPVNWFLEP